MKKVLPREKAQTTLDEIISIMRNTQKKRQALSQIPLERKLEVISELGKLWSSPDYSRRELLIEFCAEQTGYSKEMVEIELSFVPIMLNPESLLSHFNQLPGGSKSIDKNVWVSKEEGFRNLPKGNIFVVGAGNSFAPHLLTTLISLLTNNFVILRPSQSNCIALEEFKESFTELESEYSNTARIMSEAFEVVYTGHDSPAFDYLLKEA
ncbi:MAG: acyl-CoA reductase, partial [Candidatus Hermodarchaeota archaeon]